jgi:hypothetical protein
MRTRSQTKALMQHIDVDIVTQQYDVLPNKTINMKTEYTVDIDFDEASREWHRNKKKLNNGCYSYICSHMLSNGNSCKNRPLLTSSYCKIHSKQK